MSSAIDVKQSWPWRCYYFAGKATGSWFEDGSLEIGNTCGHQHRSIEAAEKCAARHEAPGSHEWKAYRFEMKAYSVEQASLSALPVVPVAPADPSALPVADRYRQYVLGNVLEL